MRRLRKLALVGALALVVLGGLAWFLRPHLAGLYGVNFDTGPGGEARLAVPPGFEASVFASGLAGPRFMAVAPDGTLLAAERGADRVVALPDEDGDGRADTTRVVGTGYGDAHAIDFTDDGTLLVAGAEALHRVTLDESGVEASRTTLIEGLPRGGHETKTVAVLPDGRVLLSIGSSCDACLEADPRRGHCASHLHNGARAPPAVGPEDDLSRAAQDRPRRRVSTCSCSTTTR